MKLANLNDHSEYAEARKLLARIDAKKAKVAAELEQLENVTQPGKSALALAEQWLDGTSLNTGDRSAELTGLRSQQKVLNDAFVEQAEVLRKLVARLSREACAAVAADHKRIASELLANLENYDVLRDKEAALRNTVDRAGYETSTLRDLSWHAVGSVQDATGSLAYYRARELREYVK